MNRPQYRIDYLKPTLSDRPLLLDQIGECPTCHPFTKYMRFGTVYGMSPQKLAEQFKKRLEGR